MTECLEEQDTLRRHIVLVLPLCITACNFIAICIIIFHPKKEPSIV